MKVYRDLKLMGSVENLKKFCHKLSERVQSSESWGLESDMNFPEFLLLHRRKDKGIEEAILFLKNEDSQLRVTNVIPKQVSSLSHDEYNKILDSFYTDFVETNNHNLHLEYSKETVELEDLGDSEVVSALKLFSKAANKSTGTSHPNDKERFQEFVILSHRKCSFIDIDIIERWLIEDGWEHKRAVDIIIEYEIGISLLQAYDKH